MKKKLLLFVSIIFLLMMVGCGNSNAKSNSNANSAKTKEPIELTISAAASLQDVLEDLTNKFNEEYPQIKIKYNFGASGSLAKQITQGAPVDMFLSASVENYKELEDKNLISKGANLVSNKLVLITSSNSDLPIKNFSDLKKQEIEKISIGTPTVVPAGTYAKQALEYDQVWDDVEKKIVYAKDVRQVLTYVESGNVQAGIVYKTDALISDKVKIVATADTQSHDKIIYPVGIIENTNYPAETALFFNYLQSDAAKKLWIKYGFAKE